MLHKPFKRRLASCLCAMLAATCVLSSLPVGATSGSYGGYAAFAATGETVNWALGKSYDSTIESYHGNNDPQLTKLTDGRYAANYDSDGRNLVGFSDQQEVSFTFDLEKTREVQQKLKRELLPLTLRRKERRPMVDMEPAQYAQTVGVR